MPGVPVYVLALAVTVGAFFFGRRLGRRGKATAGLAFGAAALVLAAKGVLNWRPDWEYALVPVSGYVYVQGWLAYPAGFLALGVGTAIVSQARDRRALTLLAAVFLVFLAWSERWMLPVAPTPSDERATADHHCAQTMNWTCGPAACVSLLSSLGVDVTEGEMIELSHATPHSGTSLFRIRYALESKLGPEWSVRIVDHAACGVPAIVSVHRLHVVAVRFDDGVAVVHDPALPGPLELAPADFRERFDGPAVVVTARNAG